MTQHFVKFFGFCAILFSCEKVKEQDVITLKTYPSGLRYSTDVYPILKGTCGECHSVTGGKDFSSAANAYITLEAHGLNKLPSQPVSAASDSVKYWTEVSQLVENSAFYDLIKGSHSNMLKYTRAQTDAIYGWVIDGGKNN